jgi:putative flippase GtrA
MKTLIRYGVLGALNNFFLYLTYLLLTYFGVSPKLAMSFLYVVGTAISFLGNRQWVFSHQGELRKVLIRYALTSASGYLVNLITLFIGVDLLGYRHELVQLLSIATVSVFLFCMFKGYVFKHK